MSERAMHQQMRGHQSSTLPSKLPTPTSKAAHQHGSSSSSSSVAYEPKILQEFRRQLEACRLVSAFERRKFILVPCLLSWFGQGDNAKLLLTEVWDPKEATLPSHHRQTLLGNIGQRKCWLKVFTVLVQMKDSKGKGLGQHIKHFWFNDHYDSKIPMSLDTLRDQFKGIGFDKTEAARLAEDFHALQLELCTDSLENPYNKTFGFNRKPLPITDKEKINEGSIGKVYQVEVPCECIPKSLSDKISINPYSKVNSDRMASFTS
jgi:hypothetical protein